MQSQYSTQHVSRSKLMWCDCVWAHVWRVCYYPSGCIKSFLCNSILQNIKLARHKSWFMTHLERGYCRLLSSVTRWRLIESESEEALVQMVRWLLMGSITTQTIDIFICQKRRLRRWTRHDTPNNTCCILFM